MVEVVHGEARSRPIASQLASAIRNLDLEGTFYLGYPILASADEPITVDGLLITRECGLQVFVLDSEGATPVSDDDWNRIRDNQDEVVFSLQASLARNRDLRKGRNLAIEIGAITVLPTPATPPEGFDDIVVTAAADPIPAIEAARKPIPKEYWEALNAAVQKVTTIKPRKKRASVQRPNSRGAVLKQIEAEIANLDRWQKWAAIESPDGPQRIRGLAGSGKTVVLALKAAYLHAQHPDWNIALTFYSRALYQQLKDLVRRFSFEHLGDEPDWDRLQILHAWGGRGRPGLYAVMADHANAVIRDFAHAKSRYGMKDAFDGVCRELESVVNEDPPDPLFDAMLIDEAQDLPKPFFRLLYAFTKEPKRIVWAYDELQHLSEAAMPTTSEMFGQEEDGTPRVVLPKDDSGPKHDIVLPVCYRNTHWALTVAHALGFGIYRNDGIVQHFDDPLLWEDIGYRVVSGDLEPGQTVTLERRPDSYPHYFKELLRPEDAVSAHVFEDRESQAQWVAKEVKENLAKDELEHDDILIVLADTVRARKRAPSVMRALARYGIDSHLVGETTSSDQIFSPDSIAITHIYRAKGNEAPMVYVLDSDECVDGYELIRLRNTLFTAVTRSRAWVRICGCGDSMRNLVGEIESVASRGYRLEFKVPSPDELAQRRRIHRDLTAAERKRVREAQSAGEKFLKALESGELSLENLPATFRQRLEELSRDRGEDEE